jgi:hypothetical protein
MNDYQHLLSKHGILVNFNIAKKIKPSQIKAIRKKLESKYSDPKILEREIDKEIKSKTRKFLEENEIPGLIHKNGDSFEKIHINKKIQIKILSLANKAVKYCKDNNFTKEHVIFFIQATLHLLKITNEDMQRFKEKYNINQDPPDDYLDEEDDGYEDEE